MTSSSSVPRRSCAGLLAAIVASTVLVAPVLPGATAGATGGPDPSFGTGGYIPADPDGENVYDTAVAAQSSGLPIVATIVEDGTCEHDVRMIVRRYTANGVIDTSFGTGGATTFCVASHQIADILVDGEDRLLVALNEEIDNDPDPADLVTTVGRLTPEGLGDTTFGPQGVRRTPGDADFTAFGLTAGPGATVVVIGFSDADPAGDDETELRAAAVRFTEFDGIDTTFGTGGVFESGADGSIAFDGVVGSSGSVHMSASYGFDVGVPTGGVESVNSTGTASSILPVPLSLPVEAAIDGQGRVLVAGANIGPPESGRVIRLTTSPGVALDPTFSGDGVAELGDNTFVGSLALDAQDRVVGSALFDVGVVGSDAPGVANPPNPSGEPPVHLFRLDTAGVLDTSVGTSGFLDTGLVDPSSPDRLWSAERPDGTLLLAASRESGAVEVCGVADCGYPSAVGLFDLDLPGPTPPAPPPAPAPAPGCPGGPVLIDASNAAYAGLAMWVCGMRLVGTMWKGQGVLMLLPNGFFSCPGDGARRPFNPGAEFGFFLLQAACGWQPSFVRTWFGRWLVWSPPR